MVTGFYLKDVSLLEFHVVEPVSSEDLEELRAALRRFEWSKVLLVISGDSAPSLSWTEMHLPCEALAGTLEVALVAPEDWFAALTLLTPHNPDVKAHHFDVGQREAALRWLLN